MQLNKYQTVAHKFLKDAAEGSHLNKLVVALGIGGEAGEVQDLLKKHFRDGTPLDLVRLGEELGDVLWYVSMIAKQHGLSLDDIAETNLVKLEDRYGSSTK